MKTLAKIMALMLIASSVFAFEKNQSIESINLEVQSKIDSNVSIEQIYESAKASGVEPTVIVKALIKATGNQDLVVEKLFLLGVETNVLFSASTASGNQSFENKFVASPTSSFSGGAGGGNSASRN